MFKNIKSISFLLALLLILFPLERSLGAIITDGTVGPAKNLTGPNFTIRSNLGTVRGSNLFHSFLRFDILTGESATFTGPGSIANVISRVTGGEASTINGLLKSEVGNANFFFINPAGIVFGPNAKVDVPAAFHASTADQLRFSDGSIFSAMIPGASALTAAPPAAFGFLSPQPATITINGSRLEFAPGSEASLSAGDISMSGSQQSHAVLKDSGGMIGLTAVGEQSGLIPLTGEAANSWAGSVNLQNADVDSSGNGGGSISIDGGAVDINNSSVLARNLGAQDSAGGISIRAENLDISNSSINGSALGEGDAGTVAIDVRETMTVRDGTKVYSNAYGPGDGGTVAVQVTGALDLEGGEIFSSASATGNGGNVLVKAGRLSIDGQNSGFTGISTDCGGTGNAGSVTLEVTGLMEVLYGGRLGSETFSQGHAGSVLINAGELKIDGQTSGRLTGISSQAAIASTGSAGPVTIEIKGLMEVLNGGMVSSNTFSKGNVGSVLVRAATLRIDGQGTGSATISSDARGGTGNAGSVTIEITGLMEVTGGGKVSTNTFSEGHAGSLTVTAGALRIEGQDFGTTGISSDAQIGSTGNAGSVTIEIIGPMEVLHGGMVSSDTYSQGSAGSVRVEATVLRIEGRGSNSFTGISSETIMGSTGDAGAVLVKADELRIDGRGSDEFTGITTEASSFSSGDAGSVTINITGMMEVLAGGVVGSDTFSVGNAGSIRVAAGELRIDGQGTGRFTGVGSQAGPWSTGGDAGSVTIDVTGSTEVLNGGEVNSSTYSQGNAGSVKVTAGDLRMNGQGSDRFTGITSQAGPTSTGNAGTVAIDVTGLMEVLDGSEVNTSTFSLGRAGSIQVTARNLRVDGQGSGWFTGIGSQAGSGTGDAGSVIIETTGLLEVLDGGQINSNTFSQGDAGTVHVEAGALLIDRQGSGGFTGISSEARRSASGLVGEVEILADRVQLANGGAISIAHYGSISDSALAGFTPGVLRIDAANLHLQNGSQVSALSEGNAPASSILLNITDRLIIDGSSRITTSATGTGDGGNITIDPVVTLLRDGLITTSSSAGRGGDISIRSDVLVLDTGFIQANAAEGARGGDIFIDTRALIAEGGNLQVGGAVRQEFVAGSGLNIIQAAAPGGEQGVISITSPEIDIAGSLVNLGVRWAERLSLAMDPCYTAFGTSANSLVLGGRGGFALTSDQPAEVSFSGDRLDELMPSGQADK